MIKISNIQAVWPFIHQKLQGKYPGQLPGVDKVKFEPGTHQENPNAIGYVTTEDADDDGNLDTIHIQHQKLESALNKAGITPQDLANINQLDEGKLNALLEAFVEILAHEQGHIADYQHGTDNPFPGGESVADTAANSALQQFRSRALLKIEIIKAAQKLEDVGHYKYAQMLDSLVDDEEPKVVDLDIFRQTGLKRAPGRFIVALSDLDTWDGDGYIVQLSPEEYQELIEGKPLKDIISLYDAASGKIIAISDLEENL